MEQLYLDLECYSNYFLALFTRDSDCRTQRFEIFNGDRSKFDVKALERLLKNPKYETVTFNGNRYDLVLLHLALLGLSTQELKKVSDEIIVDNKLPWQVYEYYNINPMPINHVDLIEVSIGRVSLKLYGGRMHSQKLQELPLPPETIIEEHHLPDMRLYCKNDTLLTRDLFHNLRGAIDLRRQMSDEYGIDLLSKSDAQIAEAVLRSEYKRLTRQYPSKVSPSYKSFKYEPPDYIQFYTSNLQEVLAVVIEADMELSDTGHVKMPKEIAKLDIRIGKNRYKLGIGGLHSRESEVAHRSDDTYVVIDRDVTSYYPNLMLNLGMSPEAFGDYFQDVYRKILDSRLQAKADGNKVVSDSLKIVLNGTFGKTSNKYSTLYSPKLLIATTLTGQLSLLMLIEMLEEADFSVVSANTDGIVIKCLRSRKNEMDGLISKWEKHTNLETEETIYEALYSRDVNNYIAIKEDGSAKTKGVYGTAGLNKNPQNEICSIAAYQFVAFGADVEDTIRYCNDLTKFITVRTVNGGALFDGVEVGKAVRWYYGTGTNTPLVYKKNGNIVPRSEGAVPVLDLPDEFPTDIDYSWYIEETNDILVSIGALPRIHYEVIPRKNSKAWKAYLEAGEIKQDRKGKYQWVNPEQHLGVIAE